MIFRNRTALPHESVAVVLATLLAAFSYPVSDSAAEPTADAGFHRGMSYVSWWHDFYDSPESDSSLSLLAETETEWVALLVTWYQDTENSTLIYRDSLRTPSDAGLLRVIARCGELGMKVMLKPHVDCQNGAWRGAIDFQTEQEWADWYASYTNFITYYTAFAASEGVEKFCVGCELCESVSRTADWEAVIFEIRSLFTGELTYAANWDNYQNVTFWSHLDVIGIDAYFDLTGEYDPTLEELLAAWEPWEAEISTFSQLQGMPVLFTEIGYRSVDGANMQPWSWGTPGVVDLEEQADCYEAAFQTFQEKPYFRGYNWWSWHTDPDQGGPDDDGYTPHGKPAEDVLTTWYTSILTAVENFDRPGDTQADGFRLSFPNPYRPGGEIVLRMPRRIGGEAYNITVYDIRGRQVVQLPTERRGDYEVRASWDGRTNGGRRVASGVYYCRAGDLAGEFAVSRPIVIVR